MPLPYPIDRHEAWHDAAYSMKSHPRVTSRVRVAKAALSANGPLKPEHYDIFMDSSARLSIEEQLVALKPLWRRVGYNMPQVSGSIVGHLQDAADDLPAHYRVIPALPMDRAERMALTRTVTDMDFRDGLPFCGRYDSQPYDTEPGIEGYLQEQLHAAKVGFFMRADDHGNATEARVYGLRRKSVSGDGSMVDHAQFENELVEGGYAIEGDDGLWTFPLASIEATPIHDISLLEALDRTSPLMIQETQMVIGLLHALARRTDVPTTNIVNETVFRFHPDGHQELETVSAFSRYPNFQQVDAYAPYIRAENGNFSITEAVGVGGLVG